MPRTLRSRESIKPPKPIYDPSSSPPRSRRTASSSSTTATSRAPPTTGPPAATSGAPRATRRSATNRAPAAPGPVTRSRSRSVSRARSSSPTPLPPGPRGRGRTRAAPRAAANPPSPPTARPSTSLGAQNPAPNRPARRSTVRRPHGGNFSDALLAQIFEDTDLDLNDTSDFDTVEDFQKALSILMEPRAADGSRLIKLGSRTFLKFFVRGEHLFENPKVALHTFQDGNEFTKEKGDFKDVYLVEDQNGLGLKIPDDLSLDTLKDYYDIKKSVNAHNSLMPGSEHKSISIKKILDSMDGRNDGTVAWNVLSLEFTKKKSRLLKDLKLPKHVRDSSMVEAIEGVWSKKVKEIGEQLKTVGQDTNVKERLKTERTSYKKKIADLPGYQRFLLISMKDSFTDIHVDLSATSVYYHVIQGKKIFYVAPGTEKNLRIYRKYDTLKGGDRWSGDELFKEFQRVEISEGETAMIPSGYLHFVYTPEDSLVIGGNYLTTQYLEKHFQLTKIEEEALAVGTILKENMYSGFYNVMWTYADVVLIPKLEASNNIDDETRTAARILLKMDPTKEAVGDSYDAKQKEDILVRLEEALEQF